MNRITKATRETTKLNFITDQGSTRAMVRCACRAERLDPLRRPPWRACLAGPTVAAGAVLAEEVLASVFERRKLRAGEDGEVGAGSGVAQVNAAAVTDGCSGSAGAGEGSPVSLTVPVAAGENTSAPIGDSGAGAAAMGFSATGAASGTDGPRSSKV